MQFFLTEISNMYLQDVNAVATDLHSTLNFVENI